MKVENISNYGKGLIELFPEINKIKKQTTLPMFKTLYKGIGLMGILEIIWRMGVETKKMKSHDWTNFEIKNEFAKENIEKFLEDLSLMKVMIDMKGEERAKGILSDMLKGGNDYLCRKFDQNLLLMPVSELKSFDDSFTTFKEFIIKLEKTVEHEGVHQVDFVEDTKDAFAFNVKHCIVHEIAKELGNPTLCFIHCQLDEVVFPRIGHELGFQYIRPGSLGSGASCCDFQFERL